MVVSSGPPSGGGTTDYSAVAGFYSQLAGVLAGFAFAGLIALLAAQMTAGRRSGIALQSFAPLISAFIGLVATSLNWAIIASEGHTARGAALESVGGLGFCVAGLMLFYSLLVLVHGVAAGVSSAESGWTLAILARTVRLVGQCINLGMAPLIVFLFYGWVTDQEVYWYPGDNSWHWPDYLGFALLLLVLVAGLGLPRFVRARGPRQRDSERLVLRISATAIAVSLLSVAGASVVFLFTGSETTEPGWGVVAQFVVLAVITVAIVFSSSQFLVENDVLLNSATGDRSDRIGRDTATEESEPQQG
jgi:hypothetical protein